MDKAKLRIVNEPVIVLGAINEGVILDGVKFEKTRVYNKEEEAILLTFAKEGEKEVDLLAELEGGEEMKKVDKTFKIQRPSIFAYNEVTRTMDESRKADADTMYARFNNLRAKTLNSILSANLPAEDLQGAWSYEKFYSKMVTVEASKETNAKEYALELKTKIMKFIYDKPDEYFKKLAERFVELINSRTSKNVLRLKVLNKNGFPELPSEGICERQFFLDLSGDIIENSSTSLYWTAAEISKGMNNDHIPDAPKPKSPESKVSEDKKKAEDKEFDSIFGS